MDQPDYLQQPPYNQSQEKQRHGCITAWLILMIIANSCIALIYLFASDQLSKQMAGDIPTSMFYVLAFISAMNVVFAVFLIQWKRWGFYGFILNALAGFAINLKMGMDIGSSLFGLVGIGILYAILQIKKNNVSAWEQME
ncbi:MAG: hypothetical protein NT084_09320 [Bacteroidetes bacterium]|nr:hypothetical protein [Bacteroidota bacterium]